jgi:hypothetical protein
MSIEIIGIVIGVVLVAALTLAIGFFLGSTITARKRLADLEAPPVRRTPTEIATPVNKTAKQMPLQAATKMNRPPIKQVAPVQPLRNTIPAPPKKKKVRKQKPDAASLPKRQVIPTDVDSVYYEEATKQFWYQHPNGQWAPYTVID